MKVLHITQTLPGGIASYLDEIIGAQVERLGAGNVVLLAPAAEVRHLAAPVPCALRLFSDNRRHPLAMWRFLRIVQRTIARERPDVVHLHSSFAGAAGRLGSLFSSARPHIVYCAHGWAFTRDIEGIGQHLYAAVERLLARFTDRIVVISRSEHDAAVAAGLPETKLRMIYNGIAPGPMHPPPRLQNGRPLRLLFVGRLDRQKGCDTLLDAMAQLGDAGVHLDIVGAGILGETPIADRPNVACHGWQPRARIDAFLADADALVVPSRWEGFGLVAAEAMRAGRAVFASDVGALPELVDDRITGRLFPSGDAAGLAAVIRGETPRSLARMGAAGRRRFLQRFTARRMNDRLLDCYFEMETRYPRRRPAGIDMRAATA